MTSELAQAIAGGLGTGAVLSAIGAVLVWGLKLQWRRTTERLDRLEEQRVAKIEGDVADLKKGGCTVGQIVQSKLETVISQNNQILLDIRKLDRESVAQDVKLADMDDHLTRLHAKVSDHVDGKDGRHAPR